MKLAIVDDEKLFRDYLRNSFEWNQLGISISWEARDGEEALLLMKENKADILLVDINMPFMNGIQLAKEIVANYDKARIILVTGQEEFEYARLAIKLGISDYILKPFNKEELIEAVRKVKKELEGLDTDIEELEEAEGEEFSFYPAGFYKKILIDLRLNNKKDLVEKLEQVFRDIAEKRLNKDYIHGISSFLISTLLAFISETGKETKVIYGENTNLFKGLKNIRELEEVKNHILESYVTVLDYMKKDKPRKGDRIVQAAIKYIDDNYHDQELCVKDICRVAYANESYLRSLFKESMGITITEYITETRMRKSKEMIEAGGIKFSELCFKVGYNDPAYFSRCFKKYFGVTPSSFEISKNN